jgi:DNA-directed RNA polymerase specialized sigma24 family protein
MLAPEQQRLIYLIYFDSVSATDIAKAEGVDKSAISHRLSRAIRSLKKYLG